MGTVFQSVNLSVSIAESWIITCRIFLLPTKLRVVSHLFDGLHNIKAKALQINSYQLAVILLNINWIHTNTQPEELS
jgi:hypothetical protein